MKDEFTVKKGILEELSGKGIMFTVHLVDGFFDLTTDQVLEYLKDPDMFGAKMHRVSLQRYKGWKNMMEKYVDGDYRCPATTKRGTPCRGTVKSVDLKDFVPGVSEYCIAHQKYGIK
ncbi:MAG: hypothetical protein HY805_05230 [Nitrospirae bacterium]|nr:hypothetical protein [Nitrospirota bacterium]